MADYSKSTKDQIRGLLLVLGSGIAAAFLLGLSMLYYYNPSGAYLAKNVLLSPENLQTMRFTDHAPRQQAGRLRYVFDGVEFSYYDFEARQWKQQKVDLKKYAEFYSLVGNDQSLEQVSDEIKSLFMQNHPPFLTIKVHAESDNKAYPEAKPFLEVKFSGQGDYYQIEIRRQGAGEDWAYFHHPEIYHKIMSLFASK